MEKTAICIVGAGPGGMSAALKLHQLGIPSILLEKDQFPRDKICGDAISGKATTLLNRLDPTFTERFRKIQKTYLPVWGIRFVAPNHKNVDIPFSTNYDPNGDPAPGYVCRRWDFDNFLADEVIAAKQVDFRQNWQAERIEKAPDGGWIIYPKQERSTPIHAKLLLVANGAQSRFARQEAGLFSDKKHFAGGLRAYYKNVEHFHPHQFIEIHYIRELLPGYFWIFPLPDGHANVGLGMRTDKIGKRKINLRKSLDELLRTHPVLKERFANAERIGKVLGFGLPLGSKAYPISGDHYMLLGDAAHLVDPMSGEGIGNAIYSGLIAAEQAAHCLETEDFSASTLKAYDQRIRRVMGKEMKVSFQLQRFFNNRITPNLIANLILRNPQIIDVLSRMYTELELREKAAKPGFWLQVLLNKYPQSKEK